MDPDDEDGFTISYMDDSDEVFFLQSPSLSGLLDEIEIAFDDGAARKVLICRQGDEDE